ncbi:hypothetical protein M2448_000545 [Dysgonomonas sp. PF1-14]|nr:hypothetical protein [Dysgonomonas sp. PF1-14]MDH6337539.1 hypothetical protein [Dysgonomonas sp. PF1-16]
MLVINEKSVSRKEIRFPSIIMYLLQCSEFET